MNTSCTQAVNERQEVRSYVHELEKYTNFRLSSSEKDDDLFDLYLRTDPLEALDSELLESEESESLDGSSEYFFL